MNHLVKVEKILKGSLDLIPSPSPSVKIQIMGRKVCFRCKGKTLLGVVNKLLKTKSLLTTTSNVLPLYLSRPQFEFSSKVMGSNAGYLLKSFYFNLVEFFRLENFISLSFSVNLSSCQYIYLIAENCSQLKEKFKTKIIQFR